MNLAAAVTRLLSERLGLSPELLGFVVVEHALNEVFGRPGPVPRGERIAHLLRGEGEEWQMLVDEIIVPETWFFRDRKPFQLLAAYVREKWRPANPQGPFRAFCIPCASGEEAYSVAMTLLDAGLEADRIRIDAGDVSTRALARARLGVYGRSSFREKLSRLEERYFLRCPEGWQIREEVAALVHLEKANLLDLSVYRQRAAYDTVFCRNALIYLEDRVRREVIASLRDLLREDGLLFTGHSELMSFLKAGFQQVNYPQSFACRKAGSLPRTAGSPGSLTSRGASSPEAEELLRHQESIFGPCQMATEAAATIPEARKLRPISPTKSRRPLDVPQAAAPPPGIEEAGQLADRGELGAATAICQRLLAEGTQDPHVYSLLGVLSESGGELEAAEDFFRKALFLDPNHYQSLVYMGLLCERRGDIDRSRLYRARAGRVLSQPHGDQRQMPRPHSGDSGSLSAAGGSAGAGPGPVPAKE
jgi:chemotaxis protein methyltransferase WspC